MSPTPGLWGGGGRVDVGTVGSLETNWIQYPQIPPEDVNASCLWNVMEEIKVRQ